MKTTRVRRVRHAVLAAALAVSVAAAVLGAGAGVAAAAPVSGSSGPVVRIGGGLVRGADNGGVSTFLGLRHERQHPRPVTERRPGQRTR